MLGNGVLFEEIQAEGPVSLQVSESMMLKARIRRDGQWSALKRVSFLNQQEDYEMLKVTELHYHPPDWFHEGDTIPGTDLEFIEFINTGDHSINLTGLRLDTAVRYQFPDDRLLPPENFYVVASEPGAFFDFYGLIASDGYRGQFSNAGEEILLSDMGGGIR